MNEARNNSQRNSNRRSEIMRWLCMGGVVMIGFCLFCAGLVHTAFQEQDSTGTDGLESPSNSYYEDQTHDIAQETESNSPMAEKVTANPSAWNLILVNPWHRISEGFSVELTQLRNGHAIDKRAYPDLQKMMDDMRAEGLDPLICSSYRTSAKQQTLYNNKVNEYLSQGYSLAQAEAEAGKWVAVPGTSEHQTGLAVDIVDTSYQILDERQEETAVQQWLMENSWKYGFILRYPNAKREITGIYYEPWHYRYVGKEVAKEIYEKGICFEEYLEELKSRLTVF